jgi:hypothetical protein
VQINNRISNRISFPVLALLYVMPVACSGTPTPDQEAIVQAVETPTQVVQPTDTPVPATETPVLPTSTSTPTETPVPPTNTPTPTDTPEPPTDTPTPTDTPAPVDTPTPAPPTVTPTSEISAAAFHYEQGLEYYQQEQWAQAIGEFQEAIRLDPEFGLAYEGLGYSHAFNEELEPAITALETYLNLVPEAENRAEVESDIQLMREMLASQDTPEFDIPPGMALFVFKNYSGENWIVDIGSYLLEVPPNPPDREFTYSTLAIEPGTYTWQAHSADAGYYITDSAGNKAFEFTVAAGEMYGTQCCR